MIAPVTLAEVKAWLRVDSDHEDATIAALVVAATEAVMDVADGWQSAEGVEPPARLRLAVLTHVASAFGNREDGAALPDSAARLLMPLRRLDV